MFNDEDENKLKFLELVRGSISQGKELVLNRILDTIIRPWYETRTSRASPRTLRNQVANSVEVALTKTLWVHRDEVDLEDAVELGTHLPKFQVLRVFPQARSNGSFTLMVIVAQHEDPHIDDTFTLEEFLSSFYPFTSISFEDYQS